MVNTKGSGQAGVDC